jgi:hypothetical protein
MTSNIIDSKQQIGSVQWFRRYIFPKAFENPDMSNSPNVRPIGLDLNLLPSLEIAEIIMLFQKGTLDGCEQQIGYLDQLFEAIRDEGYTQLNNLFIHDFEFLLRTLEEIARPNLNQPEFELRSKLRQGVKCKICSSCILLITILVIHYLAII